MLAPGWTSSILVAATGQPPCHPRGEAPGFLASTSPRTWLRQAFVAPVKRDWTIRSEEHTSELQSLMRISYAVFCLKKKTKQNQTPRSNNDTATQRVIIQKNQRTQTQIPHTYHTTP